MNLFDLRHRHIRISAEDTRVHNILPSVLLNRDVNGSKRSLLLDSNAGRNLQKKTICIGWNPKLKRPSTNQNCALVSYFSEALQVNSARRVSLADQKENAQPKPQSREFGGRHTRSHLPENPQNSSNCKARRLRVIRQGYKHSQAFALKNMQQGDQEQTQSSAKLHHIQGSRVDCDESLYEMASQVMINKILQLPVHPPRLLLIINIELFLTQNNFWNPIKPVGRIKSQTRSILSYFSQHCSLSFLHDNLTVLQQFTQRIEEWDIPVVCTILISTNPKYPSRFYDLTQSIQALDLPSQSQVFVLDTVFEQPLAMSLHQQVKLPICRCPTRLGLILYKTNRRSGDCLGITQILHFRTPNLEIRRSDYRQLRPSDLLDIEQLTHLINNHKLFKNISVTRRKNSRDTKSWQAATTLEQFKDKLTRYIKIVQMESSQNFKQQSVSYLIGDLLKRNYSIYSQFLNIKHYGWVKHEKTMQEIERVMDQPIHKQQKLYNCNVFLISI